MLAATLLVPGKTTLHRVPKIKDVNVMLEILHLLTLQLLGRRSIDNRCRQCQQLGDSRGIDRTDAFLCYFACSNSLSNEKVAVVEPGGCSIGRRPIDIHLYVLQALGVKLHYEWEEHIFAQADYFCGAHLFLKFPSVGATEQAILAAVTANGMTVIDNAAREPEIAELCRMLRGMGAKITGDQTGRIVIEGVKEFLRVRVKLARIVLWLQPALVQWLFVQEKLH